MLSKTPLEGEATETVKTRYKIVYATPDNETESRSGLGAKGNSASINNQASVRVNTIANAIKTGADASEVVHLIRTDGAGTFSASNYKIIVSTSPKCQHQGCTCYQSKYIVD